MAARVADKLWSMEDLAEAMEAVAPRPGLRGPYKKRLAEQTWRKAFVAFTSSCGSVMPRSSNSIM